MTIQAYGTGAALSATTTPQQIGARTTGSLGLEFHLPAAATVTLVIARVTGTNVQDRIAELQPGDTIRLPLGSGIRPFYYTLSGTASAGVCEVF